MRLPPAALLADDLQWVDGLSLALCHYLVRAAETSGAPLALIAAVRLSAQVNVYDPLRWHTQDVAMPKLAAMAGRITLSHQLVLSLARGVSRNELLRSGGYRSVRRRAAKVGWAAQAGVPPVSGCRWHACPPDDALGPAGLSAAGGSGSAGAIFTVPARSDGWLGSGHRSRGLP